MSYLQAIRVFLVALNDPKTCLFSCPAVSNEEWANRYQSQQSVGDKRGAELANRCENGTHEERELLKFMVHYEDDLLLRVRNSKWAPEIIRLLREEPNSYFFAFGAAHFRGNHRVQKYLVEAGFQVEHIGANEIFM